MSSGTTNKQQDHQSMPEKEMRQKLTLLLVAIFGLLLTFCSATAVINSTGHAAVQSVEGKPYPQLYRYDTNEESAKKRSGKSKSTMGEEYESQMKLSMEQLKEKEYNTVSFMLVHTGNMRTRVNQENLSSVSERIDTIVKDTGDGYYQENQSYNSGTSRETVHMTIQVRSDKFHYVIEEIRKIVDAVVSLSINSRDVTDEYVDVSARADASEAARSSLQAIMAKADTVEEVLKVQQELNRLTQSSESLRQRAQQLKKQSVSLFMDNVNALSNHSRRSKPSMSFVSYRPHQDYSTLTLEVSVMQKMCLAPSWSPFTAASLAIDQIYALCIQLTDVVIYFAVWCIPLVLLLFVIKKLCGAGTITKLAASLQTTKNERADFL
jgi:hypothetical protein